MINAPVAPLYSSTLPVPKLPMKRLPFGPKARPSGFTSPPLPGATKTVMNVPVVPLYSSQKYEETVANSGAYFLEQLHRLKSRHTTIGDVCGLGLALRIEVTQPDRFTPNKELADRIFEA